MLSVLTSEKNNIVYVSLNRPKVHNALNPEMIQRLTEIFLEAAAQEKVRAIVLSGVGKSFCSGADLLWMKSAKDLSFEENLKDSEALYDMFFAMRACLKPVVAKIQGHIFGGGLGLVAVCDIVAAEKEALFCFSEAKLGLVPAIISPFVIDKIGIASAKELMLTAKKFTAGEGKSSGLLQFVGSSTEVENYISTSIKQILNCGPRALEETKKLILKLSEPHPWNIAKKATTQTITERRESLEGQEGLESFFQKKQPPWKKDFFDERKN